MRNGLEVADLHLSVTTAAVVRVDFWQRPAEHRGSQGHRTAVTAGVGGVGVTTGGTAGGTSGITVEVMVRLMSQRGS